MYVLKICKLNNNFNNLFFKIQKTFATNNNKLLHLYKKLSKTNVYPNYETFCQRYDKKFLTPVKLYNFNIRSFSRLSNLNKSRDSKNSYESFGLRTTVYYCLSVAIVTLGTSFAAVPLYRMFCQAYSLGGAVGDDDVGGSDKLENMDKVKDRQITIRFNADTNTSLAWNFKPEQTKVMLYPGETALAFYSACNPLDRQVVGISTYNVIPFESAQYFNKIQCFCFEEQMLNPKEEVHMPVFFYIDPEFAMDPKMEYVDEITLSYTFFEVKDGATLPPNLMP